MIVAALLAAALALAPDDVLARYAAALADLQMPSAMSFDYTLDQTGMRNTEQVHRVFRAGSNERDELLAVDGRKLVPTSVHIFRGKRNRYVLSDLAPRTAAYAFRFIGTTRNGRHVDYVFATQPRVAGAFRVTSVTIDGIDFVPNGIAFITADHAGSGSLTFARFDRYWLPTEVSARATYGRVPTTERLTFARYRFADALPPATFSVPRQLEDGG